MTLKKIVNSKIIAMLLGVWIAYCAGAGDYDGVLVLLFTYLLLLLDFARCWRHRWQNPITG
ncbi:hypothetical protein CUC10_00800 [Limosilactobacillus reuteri]|nr:hypothetical protein CUC10_00800 [Limosilactobacillus reuteri]